MTKTQVYIEEADLAALHQLSERTGKSVAALIREAIRSTWLQPRPEAGHQGPVSLWNGPLRRTSSEHDSIYDEP